jgi:hypothetical protein
MVAQSLIPAIQATIAQNELGGASPYQLSFAKLGKSGASFGFMQADTNVNTHARDTLYNVLIAYGVPQDLAGSIVGVLSQPLPQGNPLIPQDTDTVNAALQSPQGAALVDQLDATLFNGVLAHLDTLEQAAQNAGLAIDPQAHLYMACWINMTGAPTTMAGWVGGQPFANVPPPSAPSVTVGDVVTYLQATSYFQAHPRNFDRLTACVDSGTQELA